jgi:maleate isomerase
MEHEFRFLIRQPGVAFYEARLFNDNDITPDTLRAIGARIGPAADLILPGVDLDVVAFGCTSATMTLGEAAVFAEIRRVRPGVASTTPVTAALAAFQAFGARRIGLLTPYAPEINRSFAKYFGERGLDIAAVATFDRRDDRDAARISVASIEDAAGRLAATSAVDAIFVSCTSLRVAEAVERMERRDGVPVTSSNHAMAWHCLRLAGVNDTVPGAGRLFELRAP